MNPFQSCSHPNELEIAIDFNLGDQLESICGFIRKIRPIFLEQGKSWHLDLSRCDYLGPYAGAVIVSLLLETRHRKQQATVRLPEGGRQLLDFCEFSGLNHYATGSRLPENTNPENITIPMRQITYSSFKDPEPLIKLIHDHVLISDEMEEFLRVCINEVVQNVEDHAKSPIGAIAAAGFVKQSNTVRVAIVDRGLGIATTLRKRYPDIISVCDALNRVIEGGVSAKSRPNNMGVGISNLCNIVVNQLNGEVALISEDGSAKINPQRKSTTQSLDTGFPGTAVFLTIPVSPGGQTTL